MSAPDIHLRPARTEDAASMAAVLVAAWREGYRGVLPDSVIEAQTVAGWTETLTRVADVERTTAVAVDDAGTVVGFAGFGPDPDDPHAATGHLFSLYVDPSASGRGIGHRLLDHALSQLSDAGRATVTLWVFRDNTRARDLYERCGFVADGTELVDPRWQAPQIRLRREGAAVNFLPQSSRSRRIVT